MQQNAIPTKRAYGRTVRLAGLLLVLVVPLLLSGCGHREEGKEPASPQVRKALFIEPLILYPVPVWPVQKATEFVVRKFLPRDIEANEETARRTESMSEESTHPDAFSTRLQHWVQDCLPSLAPVPQSGAETCVQTELGQKCHRLYDIHRLLRKTTL